MKGGRLIIIVGAVMGVLAGALVLLLMSQQKGAAANKGPTPEPPSVVRSAQNIAKGDEIRLDSLQLVRLDAGEPVPASAIKDPMVAVGMTASLDIPQGTVVQSEMYFDKTALAEAGKSAATLFQPGRVAMEFPLGDLTGVGGALKSGDHVDVVASFEMANVDPEIQALLPLDGKGAQNPRMVVQLTLQDVEILRVGIWTAPAQNAGDASATAADTRAKTQSDMLTLLVKQQDALVLQFLLDKITEGETSVSLVLRAQDDTQIVDTESVTLDYLVKRFKIVAPPKLGDITVPLPVKGDLQVR
jgi:Flp pilus assembly protein CpaB